MLYFQCKYVNYAKLLYSAKNTIKQESHLRTKRCCAFWLSLFYLWFALITVWQNTSAWFIYYEL